MYIPKTFGINNVIEVYEKSSSVSGTSYDLYTESGMHDFLRAGFGSEEHIEKSWLSEEQIIDVVQPVLIIHYMRFITGILSKVKGIPSISLQNFNLYKNLKYLLPKLFNILKNNQFCKKNYLDCFGQYIIVPDFSFYQPLGEIVQMLGNSGALENVNDIQFIGPLLRDMPKYSKRVPERNSLWHPRIYITLGGSAISRTIVKLLFQCLDITGEYIINTGGNVDPQIFADDILQLKHKNKMITVEIEQYTENAIEQMSKADIGIIHGGLSSTMEAMVCGTPILGLYSNNEQLSNLNRAVQQGVGKALKLLDDCGQMKFEINSAILELLTEGICDKALRQGKILGSMRMGNQGIARYITNIIGANRVA